MMTLFSKNLFASYQSLIYTFAYSNPTLQKKCILILVFFQICSKLCPPEVDTDKKVKYRHQVQTFNVKGQIKA